MTSSVSSAPRNGPPSQPAALLVPTRETPERLLHPHCPRRWEVGSRVPPSIPQFTRQASRGPIHTPVGSSAQAQNCSFARDQPRCPLTGDQGRKAQCSQGWRSTQPGKVMKGDTCYPLGEPRSRHAQGQAVTKGPTGQTAGRKRPEQAHL